MDSSFNEKRRFAHISSKAPLLSCQKLLLYVSSGGDILKASDKRNCHQNTIRYRLGRIREIAGLADVTDGELYMRLKVAVNIKKTGDVIGRG